jgi:hypothetical protein
MEHYSMWYFRKHKENMVPDHRPYDLGEKIRTYTASYNAKQNATRDVRQK